MASYNVSKFHNLVSAAVMTDEGARRASDAVRDEVKKALPTIKGDKARQEFILTCLAQPLAIFYSKRTGEELTAYVSNRGTVAVKNPSQGRTNAAMACYMMLRAWVKQEVREAPKVDKAKRLFALYEKLDAKDRRAFRALLGV